MRTVLETCIPRPSIVMGTFNPEVFTASLGPVIAHYKGKTSSVDAIYTDAELFFRDGTYSHAFPPNLETQFVGAWPSTGSLKI